MNLTEFVNKLPSCLPCRRIYFETDILGHFDACVAEAGREKSVVVVSDLSYRDYVEKKLLPGLSLHGLEATYCLCIRSVESYEDQILAAISNVFEAGTGFIVCLGDEMLWHAARAAGVRTGMSSVMAICSALPSRTFFMRQAQDIPMADAVYFDLSAIRAMSPGDWRETVSSLELYANVFLVEAALAQTLGSAVSGNVQFAVRQIEPSPHVDPEDNDAVARLCEGYAWLAAARAALGYDTSLDYVMRYDLACPQRMPVTVFDHAAVFARILDAMMEVESIEIDPDACARHQLPREILNRSLKQTLLEDELSFSWLKDAEDAWMDRVAVRCLIHSLVSGWEDLCETFRVRSAMFHAAFETRHMPDDLSQVSVVWQHAARFAPRHSLVHLSELLRLLDGALFE